MEGYSTDAKITASGPTQWASFKELLNGIIFHWIFYGISKVYGFFVLLQQELHIDIFYLFNNMGLNQVLLVIQQVLLIEF